MKIGLRKTKICQKKKKEKKNATNTKSRGTHREAHKLNLTKDVWYMVTWLSAIVWTCISILLNSNKLISVNIVQYVIIEALFKAVFV